MGQQDKAGETTGGARHAAAPVPPGIAEGNGAKGDRPRRHPGRAVAIALAVALACLAGVYGAGYAWFSGHFVPGTTVNGIDVSNEDPNALAEAIDAQAASWTDEVTSPGGFSLTVTAEDAGLSVNSEELARAALSQTSALRWPLELASPRSIVVEEATTIDEERLQEVVSAAVDAFNASATQPTDAKSSYDASQAAFVIAPSQRGTALDASAVTSAVATAALNLEEQTTLGDDALVAPAVTEDDEALVAVTDKANQILSLRIPLVKDGATLAQTDPATIASWISITDDHQVAVDHEAIYQWANGDLNDQAKTSDAEHDWEVDGAKTADALDERMQALSTDAVEVPMVAVRTRPAESEGAREKGRHVDVNLSTQYARLYDSDGSIVWESSIVSGDSSEGDDTPTGTYSIRARQTDQTLIGADRDGDGEPDYKSHVTYWMPFIGNSVGLHDAPWRSRFGGSIYQTNGSHGCVNLPPDAAAELYSLVRVGDTVYVHN